MIDRVPVYFRKTVTQYDAIGGAISIIVSPIEIDIILST